MDLYLVIDYDIWFSIQSGAVMAVIL